MGRFAGSFVPAVVAQTAQAMKPERSDAADPIEAVMARIPVLQDRLPPKRESVGRVDAPGSPARGVFDAFSPVMKRREGQPD